MELYGTRLMVKRFQGCTTVDGWRGKDVPLPKNPMIIPELFFSSLLILTG